MTKRLLTTRQAAWELGYSTSALLKWAKEGLIRPVSRSPKRGDMRWDLDDLRRQLAAHHPEVN
jgi:predicted site-specific integrase-resolvase